MDGSEGLLQDVSRLFSCVFETEILVFCKNESQGCSKLCQSVLPDLSSKTRLPLSKSWALEFAIEFETFDDQMSCCRPSNTTRLPSPEIATVPNVSFKGLSLLATHIAVWTGTVPFPFAIHFQAKNRTRTMDIEPKITVIAIIRSVSALSREQLRGKIGTQKELKGLDVVTGKESGILILDDTESVDWHKDNLILTGRDYFFASSRPKLGANSICKSHSVMKTNESEADGVRNSSILPANVPLVIQDRVAMLTAQLCKEPILFPFSYS
ncbi:hypothetical protein RJ640_017573 [Escallonia rubra]|uniref:Uncharacterized protein n=1 Tax=Escallonia rubra TaxID=112253 RepID=A0AA88UJG3_9ASTE|nr:hypothetical protein RJ640_017573 [Escallonia rubra]